MISPPHRPVAHASETQHQRQYINQYQKSKAYKVDFDKFIYIGMHQRENGTALGSSVNWLSQKLKKLLISGREEPQIAGNEDIDRDSHTTLKVHPENQKKNKVISSLRAHTKKEDLERKLKKINIFFQGQKESPEKPLELTCPICIDIFWHPVVTSCGHAFCFRCLDQSLLFSPDCPVCRSFIRGVPQLSCQALSSIITRWVSNHTESEFFENYQKVTQDNSDWFDRRTLKEKDIEIGKKIDVRDTEFIWCKAEVKEIYFSQGSITSILVHYEGWNSIYDQVIQLTANRIAHENFYTSRKEIPHYHMSQGNLSRMHSYVVVGDQQPPLENNFNWLEQDLNIQFDEEDNFVAENGNQLLEPIDEEIQFDVRISSGTESNLSLVNVSVNSDEMPQNPFAQNQPYMWQEDFGFINNDMRISLPENPFSNRQHSTQIASKELEEEKEAEDQVIPSEAVYSLAQKREQNEEQPLEFSFSAKKQEESSSSPNKIEENESEESDRIDLDLDSNQSSINIDMEELDLNEQKINFDQEEQQEDEDDEEDDIRKVYRGNQRFAP